MDELSVALFDPGTDVNAREIIRQKPTVRRKERCDNEWKKLVQSSTGLSKTRIDPLHHSSTEKTKNDRFMWFHLFVDLQTDLTIFYCGFRKTTCTLSKKALRNAGPGRGILQGCEQLRTSYLSFSAWSVEGKTCQNTRYVVDTFEHKIKSKMKQKQSILYK